MTKYFDYDDPCRGWREIESLGAARQRIEELADGYRWVDTDSAYEVYFEIYDESLP